MTSENIIPFGRNEDFKMHHGVRLSTRRPDAKDIEIMVRMVDSLRPEFKQHVASLWCDNKAGACYNVELRDVRGELMGRAIVHELEAGSRGHNGMYVTGNAGDDLSLDPNWPEWEGHDFLKSGRFYRVRYDLCDLIAGSGAPTASVSAYERAIGDANPDAVRRAVSDYLAGLVRGQERGRAPTAAEFASHLREVAGAESERLPPDVEEALLMQRDLYMEARGRLVDKWIDLPNSAWQATKAHIEKTGWERWGDGGLRLVVDEVDYEREQAHRRHEYRELANHDCDDAGVAAARDIFWSAFSRVEEIYAVLNAEMQQLDDVELAAVARYAEREVRTARWPQGEFVAAIIADQVSIRAMPAAPPVREPVDEKDLPF